MRRVNHSDVPDDRAGQGPMVRNQAPDGSLIYIYRVPGATNRVRHDVLVVRLDITGELFLSIDVR